MNKKFDQYVVKETIYGVSNLRLSEAIHKYCFNQDVCSKCQLGEHCPYEHPLAGPRQIASILGWHITKKEG